MAHNPKLEIFKIKLKPKNKEQHLTFYDYRTKFTSAIEDGTPSTPVELFKQFFQSLISNLDSGDFVKNKTTKKALTAYNTNQTDQTNSSIVMGTEEFIIEGVFEGGKFGQTRSKAKLADKQDKESLTVDTIIMDRYYFSLYTPDNSDTGILFLQSYSGDSVTDLFKVFLSKFFITPSIFNKAEIEKFIPQSFIDDFIAGSNIKKFSYSTPVVLQQIANDPLTGDQLNFRIRIEVESVDGLPRTGLKKFAERIGFYKFADKKLIDFNTGNVILKNETSGKTAPFEINNDFDIKPTIYLDGKISIDINGHPDLDELKNYCKDILDNEIKPIVYPENAVQER